MLYSNIYLEQIARSGCSVCVCEYIYGSAVISLHHRRTGA